MPQRHQSLERNGGQVYSICHAFPVETKEKPYWQIQAPTPLFGRKIFANLNAPLRPTRAERKSMSEDTLALIDYKYDQYKDSVVWLTSELMTDIANNLFIMRASAGPSRMGESFNIPSLVAPVDVVLGEIARGGTVPTQIASKWFARNFGLHVPRLWAGSQRQGNLDTMSAVVEVKGKEDLTGSTLLILEQAVATVTTIPTVLRNWFARCDSVPSRVIIGAFHASHESLRRLQNMGDSKNPGDPLHTLRVDVVALMLHGGMNEDGYLVNPGCGDVGVMDVGLRDK